MNSQNSDSLGCLAVIAVVLFIGIGIGIDDCRQNRRIDKIGEMEDPYLFAKAFVELYGRSSRYLNADELVDPMVHKDSDMYWYINNWANLVASRVEVPMSIGNGTPRNVTAEVMRKVSVDVIDLVSNDSNGLVFSVRGTFAPEKFSTTSGRRRISYDFGEERVDFQIMMGIRRLDEKWYVAAIE